MKSSRPQVSTPKSSPELTDKTDKIYHSVGFVGSNSKTFQKNVTLDSDPGSLTIEVWLNTDQAADYYGVSVGELRNKTSNGQIPYYKLGRSNRYLLSELRELLLKNKRGVRNGN